MNSFISPDSSSQYILQLNSIHKGGLTNHLIIQVWNLSYHTIRVLHQALYLFAFPDLVPIPSTSYYFPFTIHVTRPQKPNSITMCLQLAFRIEHKASTVIRNPPHLGATYFCGISLTFLLWEIIFLSKHTCLILILLHLTDLLEESGMCYNLGNTWDKKT